MMISWRAWTTISAVSRFSMSRIVLLIRERQRAPRGARTIVIQTPIPDSRFPMMKTLRLIPLLAVISAPLVAQERIDTAGISAIKNEELRRSQVMEIASWLTDVYGSRLTGSPAAKAAGDWTAKKLSEWGMSNVKLEP